MQPAYYSKQYEMGFEWCVAPSIQTKCKQAPTDPRSWARPVGWSGGGGVKSQPPGQGEVPFCFGTVA